MTEWLEDNVNANDITIHYHRTSRGTTKPPILLLHGITDSGLCWSRVAHDLEGNYDVLMLDARGHGRSDDIATGFSLPLLAADVAGVIRALGLEKPFLYGHSMGAITSAAVAATYPDLVRAIILEDPPLLDEQAKQARNSQEGWKWILDLKALSHEERIRTAVAMNPLWVEEELIPWADSKDAFHTDVLAHVSAISDVPWREIVSHIECPMLLISADPELQSIVTPKTAQEAAQLCKHCEVIQIHGAGHNIHRDRYEEIMAVVRVFLHHHE